jgi:hypothetical protein
MACGSGEKQCETADDQSADRWIEGNYQYRILAWRIYAGAA